MSTIVTQICDVCRKDSTHNMSEGPVTTDIVYYPHTGLWHRDYIVKTGQHLCISCLERLTRMIQGTVKQFKETVDAFPIPPVV